MAAAVPGGRVPRLQDPAVRGEDEDVLVELWRYEMLSELGFTPKQALALTQAKVDWHDAQKLLRRPGWTPALAYPVLI
jgi:hypothetical protein